MLLFFYGRNNKKYKSLTLVPVAPVKIRLSTCLSAVYASLFANVSSTEMFAFHSFCMVVPSTIPPAASVGPSVPSEPMATKSACGIPSKYGVADNAISWFLPPVPFPVKLTTVSPPQMMAQGVLQNPSPLANVFAIEPRNLPASFASQSSMVDNTKGVYPSCCASFAAN